MFDLPILLIICYYTNNGHRLQELSEIFKRVTLKDIANEAGVSVSMVSYVLNKRGRITNEKHKRILDVANKYNYVPDANARGLVTGVTNNIGLVIQKKTKTLFNQPFIMKLISELSKNLSAHSGWLSLYIGNVMSVDTLRNYLGNARLDGIIFLYGVDDEQIVKTLASRHTLCVFINGGMNHPADVANINCDDYLGIQMAFDYLVSIGHSKILFMSAKDVSRDADIRLAAYEDSISKYGFSYSTVLRGYYTTRDGYKAMMQYINSNEEMPTAIICANDDMARGVLKALSEKNIDVPGQVSVIGYDDANTEHNEDEGLSSVRQPVEKMAKYCMDFIYDVIISNGSKDLNVRMEPELIIRKSVAPPSNS